MSKFGNHHHSGRETLLPFGQPDGREISSIRSAKWERSLHPIRPVKWGGDPSPVRPVHLDFKKTERKFKFGLLTERLKWVTQDVFEQYSKVRL